MITFQPEFIIALTSLLGVVGGAVVGIYKFSRQEQAMLSALNHQKEILVSALNRQCKTNERIDRMLERIDEKVDETREHVSHIDGRLNGRRN